jgi:hypothetical protein
VFVLEEAQTHKAAFVMWVTLEDKYNIMTGILTISNENHWHHEASCAFMNSNEQFDFHTIMYYHL